MTSALLRSGLLCGKPLFQSCLLMTEARAISSRVWDRKSPVFWRGKEWRSTFTCGNLYGMSWCTIPSVSAHRRHIGTNSRLPVDDEDFPDTLNPHEHPLATVGHGELSENKKYWRKRQSEALKPVYVREVDDNGIAFAIGKRKSSVARVWLREGSGDLIVNGKDWMDYFPRADHREQIMRPFFLTGSTGQMSIECTICGGGNTGQAEALRHGVSRALLKWNPGWRKSLKQDGLLTRDSRVVESKKYGRKKARKAFQWVKR